MATKKTEALKMMESSPTGKDRAKVYVNRIAKNIHTKVLDKLEILMEQKKARLYDLQRFDLDTDKNAGRSEMTQEACEEQFAQILQLKYELKLDELEFAQKTEIYNNLFTV